MDQPKIERLLRIIQLLSGNVYYTVDDLVRKLEMSRRTVYRYIDTLKLSGFVVQREGNCFRLCTGGNFDDISQLIHFSDEEAHIVNRLIDALDDTNMLKQNLKKKLASVYDCTSLVETVVKGAHAANVHALLDAIAGKRQVVLKDYASSNSGIVSDRKVEPFAMTANYVQVWCYDLKDGKNKLFNTARIGRVDNLGGWEHEREHVQGHIDIFRFSGFAQKRVVVRLNTRAHNLLLEEYPLSERDLRQNADGTWTLDTMISNYVGVGRFCMGLLGDVEIVDSPELVEYIRGYQRQHAI